LISDPASQAAIDSGSMTIAEGASPEQLRATWSFTTTAGITWTCFGTLLPDKKEISPTGYRVVDKNGFPVAFPLGQAPVAPVRTLCAIEITSNGDKVGQFVLTVVVSDEPDPATFQMRSVETQITYSWKRP